MSVPELGTIEAKHLPIVILTSNNSREMSDALKRRCLHLFIDFPDSAQESAIVRLKVPEIPEALAAEVVALVQRVRKLDLKKLPSISETLDWTRALALLHIEELGDETVRDTLSAIFKYETDLRKAEKELREHVARQRAKQDVSEKADTKEDILH